MCEMACANCSSERAPQVSRRCVALDAAPAQECGGTMRPMGSSLGWAETALRVPVKRSELEAGAAERGGRHNPTLNLRRIL
jgi:hypothetical protein